MKKFIIKFFLVLIAIVIIINGISLFLNKTDYGQKIALSSYKNIGTFRFKRLAKLKFKNKLSHAVLKEDLDQVKKIVSQYKTEDKTEKINAKDFSEVSALQIAVWLGNKKIIEYLLEQGADIESKNNRDQTILLGFLEDPLPVYFIYSFVLFSLYSDVGGFIDSFLKVLQLYFLKLLGSKIVEIPEKKKLPWGYTLLGESRPWDILRFLVAKGANVNARSRRLSAIVQAVMYDDLKLVTFLVENGASVKAAKKGELTPLHFARSLDIAKFLLEKGADVNAVDNRGNTPLHDAMARGNVKIVELFLKKGADTDINRPNNKQITPLGMGRLNTVRFLIENYGADITSENITNKFGYACKNGNLDLVTYILEKRKKDISKKKIPLFLEKTKKRMQKILGSLNKDLQEVKDEEFKKELREGVAEVTMRYGKIISLLKSLESSR